MGGMEESKRIKATVSLHFVRLILNQSSRAFETLCAINQRLFLCASSVSHLANDLSLIYTNHQRTIHFLYLIDL